MKKQEEVKIQNNTNPTPSKTFTHDELIQALYHIFDSMERAMVPFFLDGVTAESVLTNYDLTGDGVYVGIRDVDWKSSGFSIVELYSNAVDSNKKQITFMYGDVPIYLNIYRQHPTIESFDVRNYCNEFWNLPNTYEQFLEVKHELQ